MKTRPENLKRVRICERLALNSWRVELSCGHVISTAEKPPASFYCRPCARREQKLRGRFVDRIARFKAQALRELDLSCVEEHEHTAACYVGDDLWKFVLECVFKIENGV